MAQRNHRPSKREYGAREAEKRRNIPIDIYEEILLRLPANYLINLKRVCKDWLRLISSPEFIRKHLSRSNAGRNGIRILMLLSSEIADYNFDASGGGNNNISKKIPYPPGFSGGKNATILGSCDGLICLVEREGRKVAVYNPSTGKSDLREVDEADLETVSSSWFGHHPSTGEYVLVVANYRRHIIQVYKFSCKLRSVLSCSICRRVFCSGKGVLLHGTLHWTAFLIHGNNRYMVLAYDFQKNRSIQLEISGPGPGMSCFTLGVVDGCLSAIFKAGEMFELWIMKEYGIDESWTKHVNIEVYRNCCTVLYPLGYFRIIDLVLDGDRSELMKYSFSGKIVCLGNAIVCADSLVSPALIWGD